VAGRALRTNAAIYYQDYTDIQVQRSVLLGSSFSNVTDNAAKARLWGGELEALLRLTDNLELGANASYLNIKYTEFAQGVSATTIADVKAREKLSPDWQYGLSARYRLPLDQRVGDLSVQVNWNWQAAFQNTLAASLGVMEIPAYELLNLAVTWDRIGGGPMDASFFMSNVADKDYIVGGGAVYNALAYNTTMYGEPRMYGLRLRYHFGAE
jgi:iron complex outermembrane receptor protein